MNIDHKGLSSTKTDKKHLPKFLSRLKGSLQRKKIPVQIIFFIIGLLSTLWFLIRVLPKPSRASYPCMQAAAPFMSGFIVYLLGMVATVFAFKKSKKFFLNAKYVLAAALLIVGITFAIFSFSNNSLPVYANSSRVTIDSVFTPIDSANTPVGTARGIIPGRVVWMWDPAATKWNGTSSYWWSETNTIQVVVDSMLSKSIRGLTGKSTDVAAWDTLFKYFNQQHGKGSIGYQTGEKIAIKLSLVQSTSTGNSNNNFSTPQLVLALLRQLVNNAGVSDSNVTFYDIMRTIPGSVTDKCRKEFPNVHFVGSVIAHNQEKYKRDTTSIHFSQNLILEQPTGGLHTGYLPTIVTQASYIINFANLKGHRYVGVTGCAKNHFGSMCATDSADSNTPHAIGVHPYITVHDYLITVPPNTYTEWNFYGRPMGTYNPLVDLMGNKDLGGKTLLFMTDGLYVVPVENDPNTSAIKFQQPPFNNRWTSSIFLSQDEVALESVIIDFLRTEQAINKKMTQVYDQDSSIRNVVFGNVDNFLHEAAQADNPPSGTFYHPNGTERLQSLGVHEHWNNPIDKQYTRNLGTGNGIELFSPSSGSTSVDEVLTAPSQFTLNQNYPNPFNPSTTISYALPVRSNVTLKIYDALGRVVTVLVDQEKPAGQHQVQFDAKNLASGVYFYRLQVSQISRGQSSVFAETKKLVLLR